MLMAGVDVGFGFTKASSGETSVLFKSIVGEAQPRNLGDRFFDGMGLEGVHITLNDRSYFVGELAESESRVRQFTLDQAQMVAHQFKVLSLAALSRVAASRVPVNVVTGLPVGYYVEFKDRLAESLKGEHSLVLHEDGQANEVALSVNRVKVIPQPYGSLVDHLFRDDGTLMRQDVARQKIGIVDIGFKTTDFTVCRGLQHSERGSRTTDTGMAKAFQFIAEALHEMSGINVEIYRLFGAVQQGSIKIRGAEYDISKVKDEVFSRLAAAVVNEMERVWVDDWDLDLVLLAGGGGEALYEYLKPMVRGQLDLLQTREDPRMANVYGYLKYGKYYYDAPPEKGAG
ncbi:MAG: ParM/StbA family protein [bacterium]|nr:MAG: ParM/StbA family protein [bacterium]